MKENAMRMTAIAVVALAAIGGTAYYRLSSNNEATQPPVKELTVVKDSVKAEPVDTVKPQPADSVKPEKKEEVKRHIRFTAPVIKKDVDDTDKPKKKEKMRRPVKFTAPKIVDDEGNVVG